MQLDIELLHQRAERASQLLSAMSNEKRLMILCQLVEGERSVSELADRLGIRQSTISQHLALLKNAGFIDSRRDAQSQFYSLNGKEARTVIEALYGLYCANAS